MKTSIIKGGDRMIAILDYLPGKADSDELRKVLNRIIGESLKSLTDFHTSMVAFLGEDWFLHEGGHHVSMERSSTDTIIRVVDLKDDGLSMDGLPEDLSEEKNLRKSVFHA